MRIVFSAILCLTLLAGSAHAAGNAYDLYKAGQYEPAIAAGLAQNNAEGFTLAARATLAEAIVRVPPCLDCLKRAEGYARRAIAADAKAVDARVYLAASLGYEARAEGLLSTDFVNAAQEAKSSLDAAFAIDPNDFWVLAALGGWNIEVVRNGGETLAQWIYKASVSAGLDDFAKAFRIAPANVVLRYQYALSLSGLDRDAYRSQIMDALAHAAGGSGASAYDNFAQARARELLAVLKSGDLDKYDALVKRDQGYP
jgi:hypothetical protein